MIRLICIDVDGTLLGSSGTVPPQVWSAAERARTCGIRLALCSGRPVFGLARSYAARLDAEGWHVFQNGASVVHLPTSQSRSARMAPEIVRLLVQRARQTGHVLEIYTDTDYVVESTADESRVHAELLGLPYLPRPFESLTGTIVRAQWLLRPEQVDAMLAAPHPGLEVTRATSPVMPGTTFVNLTPAGVTKATGVRAVAEAYGTSLGDVMMVGDGQNDLQALQAVGWPVAMGNAEPEVRAAARLQVGHVDDGGLAEALEVAIVRAGANPA